MQKTIIALATLASVASAAQTFSLITIHSGSQFQYSSIYRDASTPQAFRVGSSSDELLFTLNDDSTLTDSNGVAVRVYGVGDVGEVGEGQSGSSGFSVQDGHLVYQGQDSFAACPTSDYYTLNYPGNCINGTGIALRIVPVSSSSSSSVPASSSAPASSVPASSVSTTSVAPIASTGYVTATDLSTTLETITSCAPEVTNCPAKHTSSSASNYSVPEVSSYDNAAGNMNGFAGVGAAAVAAALFLI